MVSGIGVADDWYFSQKGYNMGYRVSYRGLDVVCESLEEVDTLADRLERRGKVGRFNRPSEETVNSTEPTGIPKFIQTLKGKQKKFLRLLAFATAPMSDEDVRSKLSLESNRKIAGLLTGLTKRSRSFEIENLIVKDSTRNGTGDRHYKYSVGKQWIEAVKNAFGSPEGSAMKLDT